MKFDPEFKRAISQLTSQEKDKLILRLLRRDRMLANRLEFELVSTDSVQDRREMVETDIRKEAKKMTSKSFSPAYLLADMRSLSARITDHVKTTKDKFGEASLNLLMLNEVLTLNTKKISEYRSSKVYTLGIYIIARTFKIMTLVQALHADYMIDFEDGLKKLGELINDNVLLKKQAKNNGLDLNWLIKVEIPDDIVTIQKNLRANGYLK